MKGIIITTRLLEGQRKILEIRALPSKNLPKQYLNGCPCCFREEITGDLIIINNCADRYYFSTRTEEDEKDFQKYLAVVRKCGKRLAKINKKNRIMSQKKKPDVDTVFKI